MDINRAGEGKTGQWFGRRENAGHHRKELMQDGLRVLESHTLEGTNIRKDGERRVTMSPNSTSSQRLMMGNEGI